MAQNFFDQFDAAPAVPPAAGAAMPAATAAGNFFDQFDPKPASVAADVGKQLLSSVPLAVEGIASAPAAIADLAGRGANYLMNRFTPGLVSPEAQQEQERTKAIIEANRKGGIAQYLPEPETTPGKYARTVPQFAIQAAAAPGSMARNAVTGTIAGLTSETAGQLTEGTAAEPYARIAGGVAGGVAGARAVRPRAVEAPTPSNAQIREAAGGANVGYNHPEVAAVQIRPQAVENLADRIVADLNRRGRLAVPESAGATHNVVDRLRNTGTTPGLPQGVASIEELRSARMALSGMSTELNAQGRATSNAVAAGRAGRAIDNYLDNIQQPDLLAGNARRAQEILRQANRDWAAQAKAEMVGLQQMKADRQAGRSGSGSNIENSMRQKIDSIFGPGKESGAGLTAAERAAADRIVEGSATRNVLRKVGKLGFSDGLSLLMHAGAAIPTAGASIPIGVMGTIARKVGESMTRRDIARLEEMIRQRSAEAERWRAIHARTGGILPPTLGAPSAGLLGGALAANQLRGGILPFDQRWLPIEQLQ